MIIRTISFEWGHKRPQGACQQSTCKSRLFWRQLFVRSQGSSIVNRYLLDVLAIQLIYAEHIHTFRIDAIHSKPIQLIAFEVYSACLLQRKGIYLMKICNDFLWSKFPKRKKLSIIVSPFSPFKAWCDQPGGRVIFDILYKADKINNSSGFNVSLKRYWWP